jgi:hypothetical protein
MNHAAHRAGVTAATVVLALVIVAAALPPALAHHSDRTDPNDTPGLLDVRVVEHGHTNLPRSWNVITYRRWTERKIWDMGYVLVYLDTVGDKQMDFYALIRSTGRGMVGQLYKIRTPRRLDRLLSPLDTRRGNRRSVSVEVPFHKLNVGGQRTSYRWSVLTIFNSNACRRNCFDRVPNNGAIEEQYPP